MEKDLVRLALYKAFLKENPNATVGAIELQVLAYVQDHKDEVIAG